MVEQELKDLEEIPIFKFRKYLDRLTKKDNKIVLFKNKGISCYYCTYCKKWYFVDSSKVDNLKKGNSITCKNCKNRFEVIYQHNIIKDSREYITFFEKNKRGEVIVRIFFYDKQYEKKYGYFIERFMEVERINVNREIAMKNNSYTVMGGYSIYHGPTQKGWVRDRTGFYKIYPLNNVINSPSQVKRYLQNDEKLKYSCVDVAVKLHIDIYNYLKLYNDYPKIEMFMKIGCTKLIEQICSGTYYNYPHYILAKIAKKEINMIRKYNLSYKELETYINTRIEDYELLKKAVAVNYKNSKYVKNERKLIEYLYKYNYSNRDWYDYMSWADNLGYEINKKEIIYPENPQKAHDEMLKIKTKYEENIYSKKIKEYSEELKKYSFKNNELIIRPAENQEELIYESKKLEHCVRSYAQKMAEKKTAIMFIRRKNEIEDPFVTLELKDNTVVQCRGYKNNITEPLDEKVKVFVNEWCKKFNFKSCFN